MDISEHMHGRFKNEDALPVTIYNTHCGNFEVAERAVMSSGCALWFSCGIYETLSEAVQFCKRRFKDTHVKAKEE